MPVFAPVRILVLKQKNPRHFICRGLGIQFKTLLRLRLGESEILNNIAGKYLLTSNTVTGRSECIVNADGTVKGVYTDTVQKQSGSKYSSTVFESKWTGLLKNLKQINEYSYNFNISDIIYK